MIKKMASRKTLFILTATAIVIVCMIRLPKYSHLFSSRITASAPELKYLADDRNNIVGTFISDDDSLSKWIFDARGNCYSYYDDALLTTYNYSISNSSPQCGVDVLVDEREHTSYLQLHNASDGYQCYEIHGITDHLSLQGVAGGPMLLFTRR